MSVLSYLIFAVINSKNIHIRKRNIFFDNLKEPLWIAISSKSKQSL